MAATRYLSKGSFVLALVLLLVAIASAENYNPTTTTTTTTTTSEGAAAVAKPHDKPAYNSGYVSTPKLEKLKSRMHQSEHGWKQEETDHPRSQLGNGYGSKSDVASRTNVMKPLVPEAEKPKASFEKRSSNYGAYGLKPEDGFPIGVEGVVACKSGSDYYPLQGATVRLTCSGEEDKVLCSTDERGYFFKRLPYGYGKPELCKAFLENSPSEKCSVATDVNKGINGAALSSYKILHDKRIKLYPLGPFFYTMKSSHDDEDDYPAATRQQYSSKSPAGYY